MDEVDITYTEFIIPNSRGSAEIETHHDYSRTVRVLQPFRRMKVMISRVLDRVLILQESKFDQSCLIDLDVTNSNVEALPPHRGFQRWDWILIACLMLTSGIWHPTLGMSCVYIMDMSSRQIQQRTQFRSETRNSTRICRCDSTW